MNPKWLQTVLLSVILEMEGITALIPWSFKVRAAIVVQETEAGQIHIAFSDAVISSFWTVPVAHLPPACSADASRCGMWCFVR